MKKFFCLFLCLLMLPLAALGEEVYPPRTYESFKHKAYRSYQSDTLKYTVETFLLSKVRCYLTKIWVQDPARQIRKATAVWGKNLQKPKKIAEQIPEAALVINGSGFWSPQYPDVPENYFGEVSDYYYTPWGSLTVTDGTVFRSLELIPYSGLTLEADGLHMYVGADPVDVLAAGPLQTWSFRDLCPIQLNGEILTPEDWEFAAKRAQRTVIGRVDRNNYLILSVTKEGGPGLSLHRINEFFQKYFELEWLYNLDGGPSSALLARKKGRTRIGTLLGGGTKVTDIMAFIELPAETQE